MPRSNLNDGFAFHIAWSLECRVIFKAMLKLEAWRCGMVIIGRWIRKSESHVATDVRDTMRRHQTLLPVWFYSTLFVFV